MVVLYSVVSLISSSPRMHVVRLNGAHCAVPSGNLRHAKPTVRHGLGDRSHVMRCIDAKARMCLVSEFVGGLKGSYFANIWTK